jgi:glycosidase
VTERHRWSVRQQLGQDDDFLQLVAAAARRDIANIME